MSNTRLTCVASRCGYAGLSGGMRGIHGNRRRPLIDKLNDTLSTVDRPQWTLRLSHVKRDAVGPSTPWSDEGLTVPEQPAGSANRLK